MEQSESVSQTISLRETVNQVLESLEAIQSAEDVGHMMAVDVFEKDLVEILNSGKDGLDRGFWVVSTLTSENEAIEIEIHRLNALKARNERSIARLKGYAEVIMTSTGTSKLLGNFGRGFHLRVSTSVQVLDESRIPEEYTRVKTTIEPDKAAILKLLREGGSVPGTELAYKKSVIVK